MLQYLRNIARSSNQIHLDQNIATLKRSKVWKASAQLQKYFDEFWGLHLEVKYFYSYKKQNMYNYPREVQNACTYFHANAVIKLLAHKMK